MFRHQLPSLPPPITRTLNTEPSACLCLFPLPAPSPPRPAPQEVDKVELVYTKFVSLIASSPVIQTLLPLSPSGEVCDINGVCVDAADDEIFKLTTREGQLVVESETVRTETADFDAGLIFEQDPVQIVDALLPLYMNASLLRSLQEALASELAARMSAMASASDNAGELKRSLTLIMNRKRQAKITTELTEIVAGASSV